jgi:hypothetical protein
MVRDGEMSEWPKEPDSKSGVPVGYRGFESRSLRNAHGHSQPRPARRLSSCGRQTPLPPKESASDADQDRFGMGVPNPPGEMTERPKVHDWKSCVPKGTVGSNPTLSAGCSIGCGRQAAPTGCVGRPRRFGRGGGTSIRPLGREGTARGSVVSSAQQHDALRWMVRVLPACWPLGPTGSLDAGPR